MFYDTNLPKIEQVGIALDIDETLSDTISYWIKEMQEKFGNPEGLSVDEMIKKYRYTWNIPYRQTKKVEEWILNQRRSNPIQEKLPIIKGAQEFVKKIHTIVPIVAYITVRPSVVYEGTKNRLEKHAFPQAPIIMKAGSLVKKDRNERKAQVLENLYPSVIGIVDDNAGLIDFLSASYQGKVFLFGHNEIISKKDNIIACTSRKTVYEEIKFSFNKKK